MIPIKLSVQGLYSYQALQEIEFQPLIGASVFGIFGKVGSGKSSLLEAISFVLYGESERLNSRDNRSYNMMNLKSGHLIIDFEFRAGADHQLYKFVYEAKRHPKKHHEIASSERRSFQWDTDKWLPLGLEKDDVATLTKSILGLDYPNFKRTIIIPQNQFREFLELNPKDRTDMMSRMFRLEKYDLAGRVTKLEKVNEAALNTTKGQLEGVDLASPETIETARQSVEAIEKEIQGKEQEVEQASAREKQLIELQKRHEECDKTRDELEKLQSLQPDYHQIREQIEQFERCMQWFSLLFSQAEGIERQQQEISNELQKSAKKLDDTEKRLPDILETYLAARQAYDNRDELKRQRDELEDVLRIRTNQHLIEQLSLQEKTIRKTISTQQANIDRLKNDRIQHLDLINQGDGADNKLEQLYTIQYWFTSYLPLKKAVDELDQKILANERAVEDIKNRKTIALSGFPPEWNDQNLKQLPDTIQAAIDVLQGMADERQATHDDHLLRQKVHQYAVALVDGKPCPLCGSEYHPAISHDTIIDDDVARSKEALTKVNIRIKEMNALTGSINALFGEIKTVHGQGKELINERTKAVLDRTTHEDQFVWPEFTMEQGKLVADAIRDENARQEKLQNARKAIDKINDELEIWENKKAGLDSDAANLAGQLAGLTKAVTQQLEQLTYYKPADIGFLDPQRINDLTDNLTKQYEGTKSAFSDAERAKSVAEEEQIRYRTEVKNFTKQQAERQNELDKLETDIVNALTEHGYTRPQVNTILRSPIDVRSERQRIQAFEQMLVSCQTLFDKLTIELANQPFESAALQLAQDHLSRIQGENKALNQQLGESRKIYRELVAQWEKKQAIQEQLNAQLLRQKDLADMTALFRAQGFVNYVSSVYLQNLCEAANERFAKLTNNHLKLEIDDKNNFLVRDHLNGGQTRLAKTLSGGQLFQASLSLALALSDNIQHLTKSKQNLFFLDEGFGSLDKDSLQTVFKTLQALRNENRIVGIISHVEELQHEIETFIRAEHTDTGSRITKSWE